jgi:hypothetical protein
MKKTGIVFFLLCLVLSACNSKKEIATPEAAILPEGATSIDSHEESTTGKSRIFFQEQTENEFSGAIITRFNVSEQDKPKESVESLSQDASGNIILRNTTWLGEISADKQSRIVFRDTTAINDIVEYIADEPSSYRGIYTYRIEGNQVFFEKQDDTPANRVIGVKNPAGVTKLIFSPDEKDTLQTGAIDNGKLTIGNTVFTLQQGNLDFLSWTTWETGEINKHEYKLEFKEGRVTFISVEYFTSRSPPYTEGMATLYMTYPYTVNETDKTFSTQRDIYEGKVIGDTLTVTHTPDDYDAPKIGQIFKRVKE